jgi:type IV pilus assembly protein PilM
MMLLRTSAVSVDIGSYSVKVAQLEETRGGIRAIRFAEQLLPPDYRWEIGGDRAPLVEAVREALSRAGIRRRAVILALPRRQVTARISAYPPADRSALRRVIEYDLADQIPFPVDQVVLDFQPLGPSRDQAGLNDVLVIAAQRELVREYLALAQDLGLRLVGLTVDALALHDLVRRLPDIRGLALTLEIGARATTINISEGGRLRLSRSVGLGSQQFTLAVRDDLGVGLEEAERLKVTEGLAVLERRPRPHRVAAWLENLQGEIRRSALSFGPAAISRLFFLGPASALPGLAEAIRSELGLEPTPLSAGQLFPRAHLRGDPPQAADHCLLAIGQALRGTAQSAWAISLVPPEVAQARRARVARRVGLAAVFIALVALITGYVLEARALGRRRVEVRALERQAKAAEGQSAAAKGLLGERDQLGQDLEDIQPAQARRYAALELLRTISEFAPKGVVLTHFTLRPEQPLVIQGTAPNSTAVADLQAGLASSRLITRLSLDRVDQSTPVSLYGLAASRARNRPAVRGGPPMAAQQPDQVIFSLTAHLWTERASASGNRNPRAPGAAGGRGVLP